MLATPQATPAESFLKKDPSFLNESVKSVHVRFTLPDSKLMEPILSAYDFCAPETKTNQYLAGECYIGKTRNVGVKAFLLELEDAGYELIHANSCVVTAHHVNYVFRRKPHNVVPQPADFVAIKKKYHPLLSRFAGLNWVVRAYCNPHAQNVGEYGQSITCENFGNNPSLRPDKFLRIIDEHIVVD
jgi:hypothetical protein